MTQEKPDVIDRSTQETYVWLHQIGAEIGNENDLTGAYHALRCVMHILRDALIPDEALDLASQLPTTIRGIYFEGYKLAGRPVTHRHRNEFLHTVEEALKQQGSPELDPEVCTVAVFNTLNQHLTPGQVSHARDMLHKEVQELWPEAALR